MASASPGTALFTKTAHVVRKERSEAAAKWIFLGMAVSLIVPLLAIIAYLLFRAAPSLSWEFLVEVPKRFRTRFKIESHALAVPIVDGAARVA